MLTAILALALQAAPPAQVSANPPAPPPSPPVPKCQTEEHAAFDFWVGEWEVFDAATDTKVGHSRIERVSTGCAIRETWMPTRGFDGSSMSFIDHRSGRWEQVWIAGSGIRVDFSGGPVDGNMVLSGYWDDLGGPGKDVLIRMTYTANEDGSVRQFGEGSTDQGKTWQNAFDLIYRPKKDPAL